MECYVFLTKIIGKTLLIYVNIYYLCTVIRKIAKTNLCITFYLTSAIVSGSLLATKHNKRNRTGRYEK